jgi:uncharacterized lipoprotein YmbA
MKRRYLFSGAAALALSACASTPPSYYRLAAIPMAVQRGGPASIGVRSVGIPGYLDQTGIVRVSGAYQFDTYANELWAEPLADMLQAVLVEDLAQILPGTTVLASGGAIEAPAAILIETNTQKFDPDPSGNMVLLAQVAIKTGKTRKLLVTKTLTLSMAPSPGVTGTVAAMSQLWAQAAEQIAAMVVQVASN